MTAPAPDPVISAEIDTQLPTAKPGGILASDIRAVLKDMDKEHASDAVYNVQDYGAVGDGTTDDHAAITAALTAMEQAGGIIGKLYFPPLKRDGSRAFYNVNSAIVIGDGTKILNLEVTGGITQVGDNTDVCGTIWTNAGSTGFPAADNVFRINPGNQNSFSMRNLTIDGNGDNHTKACIQFGANQFGALLLENLAITQGGYNIHWGGIDVTNPCVRRCQFTNAWIATWGMTGGWQNGSIEHCVFDPTNAGAPHLLFEASNGLNSNPFEGTKFNKCVFEGTSGNAIQMNPGARQLLGLIFDSCWFEANQGAFFYINGQLVPPSMISTSFLHCHFVGTGSDNNHVLYAPSPGGAVNGNRIYGVTFFNTQFGGLGANALVLKVDATPTNPGESHFESIVDLDGSTIGIEGDGTKYPFLKASDGGPGNLGLTDTRFSLYGGTPRVTSGGHYPKFADPRNGVWAGIPLQLWSENAFQGSLSVDEHGGNSGLKIGGLNGSVDFVSVQVPALTADPSTAGWGSGQAGAVWFNTTTSLWKGWNGSAVKTFTVS